jgi:hypothetical protein
MNLSEFPTLIKSQSLKIQSLVEIRDRLMDTKKEMDIEIERKVQALDPKVFKNETLRDIARFDHRTDQYNDLLIDIINVDSDIAVERIQFQYLRDEFSVAKIEHQGAIAAANYV